MISPNILFALVKNGEVVQTGNLPTCTENISGLNLLTMEELAVLGWLPLEIIAPVIDYDTQRAVGEQFEILSDKVIQTTIIEYIPQEELDVKFVTRKNLLLESIRAKRDSLLLASDFTQLSDTPYNINKKVWAEYRQQLRELPTNFESNFEIYGFNFDSYFPISPENPPNTTVPSSVSRFQAKAALLESGLLDTIESTMSAADSISKLAWENALEFRRDSPTINSVTNGLNLTTEQVDNLFTIAATIDA